MESKLINLNPVWLSSGGEGVFHTDDDGVRTPAPLVEHSAIEIDCPCGCGDRCCIPVEKGYGIRWNVKDDIFDFDKLSLTPSIQRTVNHSMCRTHFHITDGYITA